MKWRKDSTRRFGGRWRCAVKHREYSRRSRKAHLEVHRERERRYRVKNREDKNEKTRRWRAEHAEENREKDRERSLLRKRERDNERDQKEIDRIYAENPWLKEMKDG